MSLHNADLFSASKSMNERVAEYLTCEISRITDAKRHNLAVAALEDRIKGLENCRGSVISDEEIDKGIKEYQTAIAKLKEDYKAARAKAEVFCYTKEDVTLYKAVNAGENVVDAVVTWASVWGLDLKDTRLAVKIAENMGGKKKNTSAGIIRSECAKMLRNRSRKEILDVAYCTLAEEMVAKGLRVAIPDDIKAAFAPKPRKKAEEKAQ